jgi:hypothetical protein
MMRRWFGPAALLATFLYCSPLTAGEIIFPPDTDPNAPEGGESEENWNPVVTCTLEPGQTLLDLLLCLENEIESPPPACVQTPEGGGDGGGPTEFNDDPPDCFVYPYDRSDFNVTIMTPPAYPYWGIRILQLDGSEIERLAFRETDPGIQATQVHIDKPNRIAIYEQINEQPAGTGWVHLTLDGNTISYSTYGRTTSQLNTLLQKRLLFLGYSYSVEAGKVTVYNRQALSQGIRLIGFRSTDPGITKSNLELRPDPDPPEASLQE